MNACVVIIWVCLFQGLFLCWKDIFQELFTGLAVNETFLQIIVLCFVKGVSAYKLSLRERETMYSLMQT